MRAFVLTDPALASEAGRFVWLELNTDLTQNEPVLRKHEADALPTFLIVDPKDERVVLRWVGSFTVAQLLPLLEEARARGEGSSAPASPAEQALERADRLYGGRDYAAAAAAYREALAAAEPGWTRAPRALEALLYCYQSRDEWAQAVALARERLPQLSATPSALVVSLGGLDSALALPADDPSRAEAVRALASSLREALDDPRLAAAADDRSSAFSSLLAARKDAKDVVGARRVAAEWAAFLESQAAKAKTAEERSVFDSHRLSAYLELGQAGQAVTMLKRSERQLPGDYNPPNRLARAYAALGRWPASLAASRRAEALASGRARLRVLTLRAELLEQKGDRTAARRTIETAIAFAESLPAEERPAQQVERLRRRLAALGAAAPEAPRN